MGLDISNSIFADAARFFFLFSSDILFAVSARAPRTSSKCLISRFLEDVNKRKQFSFLLPELRYSLLKFKSKKTCQNESKDRDGISAIKFQTARIF